MSWPRSSVFISKLFAVAWAIGIDAIINSDTIAQDKAAVFTYLRLQHKDPLRGYILCCVVRVPDLTLDDY